MIVVDTNILVHFWLPSDLTEISDSLYQKDPIWLAPILWRSEFRNVVSIYLRKKLITLSEAFLFVEKAELQMQKSQFQIKSSQVLSYVHQSNCTSYDCEFIALANEMDVQLVTFDKQILSEFPDIAIHPEEFIA